MLLQWSLCCISILVEWNPHISHESKRAWPSFEALHRPGMFLIGSFNSISHIKESLSAKIWPLIFFYFFFLHFVCFDKNVFFFFFCYFKFLESWLNFLCLVINELKNEFKNAFLCLVIFVVQFKTIIASILCKAITYSLQTSEQILQKFNHISHNPKQLFDYLFLKICFQNLFPIYVFHCF